MDTLIESNKHSSILSKLDAKRDDSFDYSISKHPNVGNYGVQKVAVSVANKSLGSQVVIPIPKYGLLRKLVLRYQIGDTTSNVQGSAAGNTHSITGALAIQAMNYIALQTASGAELCRLYPDVLMIEYQLKSLTRAAKYGILMGRDTVLAAHPSWADAAAKADTIYEKLYADFLFWFAEKSQDYFLNTKVVQDLQLIVDFKAHTSFVKSADAVPGMTGNMDLLCYFVRQSIENEKVTLGKMFPGGSPFLMTIDNYFKESVLTTGASGNGTVDINCDSPVVASYILVRTVASVDTEKYFGSVSLSDITTVSLNDSGTTIWSSTAIELECIESLSCASDRKLYKISWGSAGFDDHLVADSGAVSFAKLSNPQLAITTGAGAAAYIYVYHKTLNMLSITPNAGFRNCQIEIVAST